jgi:hypothetical protein
MQESGLPGEDVDAGVRVTWRRRGCRSPGYLEKTWMQEPGLPGEDVDAGILLLIYLLALRGGPTFLGFFVLLRLKKNKN